MDLIGAPKRKGERVKGRVESSMPIYEYECSKCHREFNHLVLRPKQARRVKCRFCKSGDVRRILSSFSVHQTEETRLSALDTSKPQDVEFYKDSRNVGLYAKKRMQQLGVDLGPKMDEIVERGRSGKILDDYEK